MTSGESTEEEVTGAGKSATQRNTETNFLYTFG